MYIFNALYLSIYALRITLFGKKFGSLDALNAVGRVWFGIVVILWIRITVLVMEFNPYLLRHKEAILVVVMLVTGALGIWSIRYYRKHHDALVGRFFERSFLYRLTAYLIALAIPLFSFLSIFWKQILGKLA